MSYITTNHPFVIDEKHPSDVFGEMANFFSLYTVASDSLSRMSIQLCVPSDFDIDSNQKLHDSYQQFIKAVRYSIPDINVLPIKHAESDSQKDRITLMIQNFEGRVTQEVTAENAEVKPKLYQKILGRLLPKFASETTPDGLYPEQVAPTIHIPEPMPILQPVPVPQPTPVQPPQAIPQAVPVQAVAPVVTRQPQVQSQQPIQSPPLSTPIRNPMPTPTNTNPALATTLLPKPSKSIRPYREILIQAILAEVQKQASNSQPITAITFKTKDSLTNAFIETVFATFSSTQNGLGRAGDSIDLSSFGLEELRPQLANMGVTLSDEAQFLLNSKVKARSEDIALIQQGQLDANAINLGVKLDYAQSSSQPRTQPKPTPQSPQPNENTLNTNPFNIAINIKVSDSMGERTVKLREFPAIFSTQNSHAPNAKLIKIVTNQAQGELFYLAEKDGQLLVQSVASHIVLQRDGQASPLQDSMTLLPYDVLQIGNEVVISLLLN